MNTHRSSAGARSFTLIEIMITLVITGVLATIAIPAYQNFIEDGRATMCEKNLEALGPELQMYIVEHNVVPGDLGQLPRERIEKALARARAAAGWQAKLVLFMDEQSDRGYAFAGMVQELAKGNLGMLICPSDPRRNSGSVVSYGVNNMLIGMNKDTFMAINAMTVLIGDSINPTFSNLADEVSAQRHKHISGLVTAIKYANGITKGGWVTKVGTGSVINSCKIKEIEISNQSTWSRSYKKIKISDLWKNWH